MTSQVYGVCMSEAFKVPEWEVERRDINPFGNLPAEFYQEHAGEMIAVDDFGEVLVTGTVEEVQQYLSLLSIEDAHVMCIPDFSQATEQDLLELFGISDAENDVTDETRQALGQMLDDE